MCRSYDRRQVCRRLQSLVHSRSFFLRPVPMMAAATASEAAGRAKKATHRQKYFGNLPGSVVDF
jgi:hypothetical protein